MNVDELRATLHAHAGDVDGQPDDPMPALRTRIRRRNRAKAAIVAGVGAAVVITAAAVVPGLVDQNRDTLPAGRPTSTPTPSLSTSVFRTGFPTRVDGDPLIASYVGQPDHSTGTLTFTATGHGLTFRPVCKLPRWVFGQSTLSPRMLKVSLDGAAEFDVSCSVDGSASESVMPQPDHRAKAGQTVTVVLTLERAQRPIKLRGAQLALGIYDHSGPTRTKAGFTLPVIQGTPGHERKLRRFVVQRLSATVRDLRATLPPSKTSIMLTTGGGHGHGVVTTTIHGPNGDSIGDTAGGLSHEPLPAGGRRTVIVHAGKHVTGTLVLAYYTK